MMIEIGTLRASEYFRVFCNVCVSHLKVGGAIKDAVYANLNVLARVSACGAISSYNLANPEPGPTWEWLIITKQVTISGFLVFRWKDQWPTAFKQFAEWSKV